MSNLGKILLYVALAGALAAIGLGVAVVNARIGDRAILADTQTKEKTAELAASTAKKEAEAAKQAQTDAEGKLATDDSKITDLNSQLADAQKQAADAKAAVDKANADAKTANDNLAALNTALDNKSPDEIKAQIAKAQSDLQAAQDEQKILQDNLQAANQKVAEYADALKRSQTTGNKPGVAGKVTFVDRTWNFVVLDVGIDDGVVPNGELIVYRGRNFLGKVRITKADANDCVAEILPDIKGDIQIGDSVLN